MRLPVSPLTVRETGEGNEAITEHACRVLDLMGCAARHTWFGIRPGSFDELELFAVRFNSRFGKRYEPSPQAGKLVGVDKG